MDGIISKLFIYIASNSVMLGLPNNKFFGPAKPGRGTYRENHLFSPPMKFRDIFVEDHNLVGAQPPPCCSFARDLVGKMVIQKAHLSSSRSAQPSKLFGSSHMSIIFYLICFFGVWKKSKNIPQIVVNNYVIYIIYHGRIRKKNHPM